MLLIHLNQFKFFYLYWCLVSIDIVMISLTINKTRKMAKRKKDTPRNALIDLEASILWKIATPTTIIVYEGPLLGVSTVNYPIIKLSGDN